MKHLYLHLRSKVRVNAKNFYYRITVPFFRLFNKQMIETPRRFAIEISSICNFNCVFCAYQHTTDKMRKTMSLEDFKLSVNEAVNNGAPDIALTPLTGDIFDDRIGIIEKFLFLENHPKLKSYTFTTNASLLDDEKIDFLKKTSKLKNLKISIYGHDKDSFTKITQTKLFDKVFKNILYLKNNIKHLNFKIEFGIRSYMDFDISSTNSKLLNLIKSMKHIKNINIGSHKHYTNWGGYVKQDNLNGLPIILKDDKNGYKSGPCARLFSYMVLSNCDVILCACRDAMREMVVGNIKEKPLKEIISFDNPLYKKWIDDQENDKFKGPCKDCDMYRPVYALPHYELGKKQTRNYVSYKDFFNKNSDVSNIEN